MKNKKIELRVTDEERESIIKNAEKTALSISEFMRRTALHKNINPRFSDEELQAWKNLTYISNSLKNLNNILSKENRDELIFEIKKINEQIKQELKKYNE